MHEFQLSLAFKNNVMAGYLQALCQIKATLLIELTVLTVLACSLTFRANATDWQFTGLSVNSQEEVIELQMERLSLAPEHLTFSDIKYTCKQAVKVFPEHGCEQAQLQFNWQGQTYQASVSSQINFTDNQWAFTGSTNQGIQVSWSSENDHIEIDLQQVQLAELLSQWPGTVPVVPEVILTGALYFNPAAGRLFTEDQLAFSELSYEHSEDVIAAMLQGTAGFSWDINDQHIKYALHVTSGEALVNALYVDFSQYAISHTADIQVLANQSYLVQAALQHQDSFAATADFELNSALEWHQPQLHIDLQDAETFNKKILSSVLGIYGFGNTEMAGGVGIKLNSDQAAFDRLQVTFDEFYLLNETRKLGVDALHGVLNWQLDGAVEPSDVVWEELVLAGLPISSSQASFEFVGERLSILGPHRLPIYDGAIEMRTLQLNNLFAGELDLVLEAEIIPISLKLITEKLGWPVMAGQISGTIPGMVKQGSVIQFLGALDLQVFGGDMRIDELSMERLFGVAPVIAADIEFDGFDLALLTQTFGFGLITGRLSGEIDGLRITNWKTDRMDAQIYTVETPGVEQTISQRAIDNISSLGGIKGAISKTFLRFFDDFKYKKIKLSCKLHNSVCEIGGLKNQQQQFVIVEGGGIPKINIVGYVRSIDWEEFIERLLNANYDSSETASSET